MASRIPKLGRTGRAMIGAAAIAILFSNPAAAQVDQHYHTMRRSSPGFTYTQYATVATLPVSSYVASQLNYTSLANVEAFVSANYPTVNQTPDAIHFTYGASNMNQQTPLRQMREAYVYRRLFSDEFLYLTTVDFWSDHLNIDTTKAGGYGLFPHFHNSVSRKHTFGTVRNMLRASIGLSSNRATAMLEYLDNTFSNCGSGSTGIPNENLAREFVELHCMGTDPQGYAESEVPIMAAFLSGLSKINGPHPTTNWGAFQFKPGFHCSPGMPFLGISITPNPSAPTEALAAVDRAIDYVDPMGINGQYCRKFIAKKLVRKFLTDVPPMPGSAAETALNNALAAAETAFGTDGNIDAMIQAILTGPNVSAVVADGLHKYMPPRLFASSLFRAVSATFDPGPPPANDPTLYVRSYTNQLASLDQSPLVFTPPIGYPDSIGAWVQDQPGRWRFAYNLMTDAIPGVSVKVDIAFGQAGVAAGPPATFPFDLATAGHQVNLILAAGNLDPVDELVVQRWVNDTVAGMTFPLSPTDLLYLKQHSLALGATAPSFSRY